MDKELEEAQSLTKNDLIAKLAHGRPAKLSRRSAPRDPNQRAKRVMDAVVAKSEREPRILVLEPIPGPFRDISELTVPEERRSSTAVRTVRL
jgi:hypothetical protein